MAGKQYDLIVIGGGLAEHIAATLIVQKGYQVLRLATDEPTWEEPLACCAALDKLLEFLAGEPLPYYKTDFFQLVTKHIRLEVCGDLPLAEELQREIPDHPETVLALLNRLDHWGHKLNLLLAGESPEQPAGLHLPAFYWRQLRQKELFMPWRRSIDHQLGVIGSPSTRQALSQLFYGLCLGAPSSISCAEAALKWHTATRPKQVATRDLTRLLESCFTFAGGQRLPAAELHEIQYRRSRIDGISTEQGRHLKARQYLVGPFPGPVRAPLALSEILKSPSLPGGQCWILTGLPPQRPPMLASQIILAGSPTLRLSWPRKGSNGKQALVEAACGTMATDTESVRRQLVPLLPFTNFRLTEVEPAPSQQDSQVRFRPRSAMPEPIAPNALLCHGASLLPAVGLNADVMLGQAAAGMLQRRLG